MIIDGKPFAPSADRNKQAILAALTHELSSEHLVFEFGSGTGQHVSYFARHLTTVRWQPSDIADKLPGIRQWTEASGCDNILPPIELDLSSSTPELPDISACYSANTLHIVSWLLVERLFQHAATMLRKDGKLCVYGPFRFHGTHVSDGNQRFDQQLRAADADSGIREFADLDRLAQRQGFRPARIVPMPTNNHLLIWDRECSATI
jgi:SAM-dependent methyltransferase